jgi:hypothetical protein
MIKKPLTFRVLVSIWAHEASRTDLGTAKFLGHLVHDLFSFAPAGLALGQRHLDFPAVRKTVRFHSDKSHTSTLQVQTFVK